MLCWSRKVLHALDEASLRNLEESHQVRNMEDHHARVQAWINESADIRGRSLGSFLRRMKRLRLTLYSECQTEHQERLGFEGWIPNRESECCSICYSDLNE